MTILESLFHPKSIAVIGASDNPNKVGGRPIHYMKKFGYQGRILPINPARKQIQGIDAYNSIESLKTSPDAAIIAVGSESVLDQVRLCADRGVGAAVIMASGFGELGEEGKGIEAELVKAAQARNMRLVGPNAQGTANFSNGAILNFSTMFMEIDPQDGPIAVISQSGAASVMPYALLRKAGYGVRYIVATGNDADISASTIAEELARDEQIKLILVYLESLTDPERLASAAATARQRGAYVVALKSGASKIGAAAASSHTGAVVGDDVAVNAFLARHGIWRAHDMNELIRTVPLYLQDHPVGKGRTVAMSHSGAVSVMIADSAERMGMPLSDISAETKAKLAAVLPSFATPSNPLDMTAAILGQPEMFPAALNAIGADEEADMVLVGVPVAGPGFDVGKMADATLEFEKRTRKPLIVCAPQDHIRAQFERRGLPTFVTEIDGQLALHQYASHQKMRDDVVLMEKSGAINVTGKGLQDESQSLTLLRSAGIETAQFKVCRTVQEAVAASEVLGGDVVVKGCAKDVPHKSEHRLVHVSLRTSKAVAEAAEFCLGKLTELKVADPRVIVAKMVRGGHEFALGVKVDPTFGPMVLIGEGGVLLEIRKDIAILAAPFTVAQAKAACRTLRVAPLFDGYRNQEPLDLEGLALAAVALGNFASATENQLVSIDANPVMVLADGKGAVAVDAVVQLKD